MINQSKNLFQQDLLLEGTQWKDRLPMTCVENRKAFATIKAGLTTSWFLLSVSTHHSSVQEGRHRDPIASWDCGVYLFIVSRCHGKHAAWRLGLSAFWSLWPRIFCGLGRVIGSLCCSLCDLCYHSGVGHRPWA